jgi:hypothetical protein
MSSCKIDAATAARIPASAIGRVMRRNEAPALLKAAEEAARCRSDPALSLDLRFEVKRAGTEGCRP